MKIIIIPDRYKSQSYSEKWAQFLLERGHQVEFTQFSNPGLFDQIRNSDGLMWRPANNPDDKQKARRFIYLTEKILKIPVFPNVDTYWQYDDKISQSYFFNALGIPAPITWIFWDEKQALVWAQSVTYPVIHKLSVGASSNNVVSINSIEEATKQIRKDFSGTLFGTANPVGYPYSRKNIRKLLNRLCDSTNYLIRGTYPPLPITGWQPEKNYSYFQEFIHSNNHDTRVTIIGNRGFAFHRWNRKNDFRASGSGNLDYTPSAIDLNCLIIAFNLSRSANFQCMSYDFLSSGKSPLISEMSYTFSDQAIFDCPGYWDQGLNWHEGHLWPEEAQVIDFLNEINGDQIID